MTRDPGSLVATALALALVVSIPQFTPDPKVPSAEPVDHAVVAAPAPPVAAPAPPPAAASRKDDPGARRDFELLRLADPATGALPHDIRRREVEFARGLPARGDDEGLMGLVRAKAPVAAKISGWVHRGPVNIGGRTRAVALDITDPSWNTLLAGGISGGMWRTTDGGSTWNLTTGSSQLHSVTAVAQDTRAGETGTWYYGTGELRGNSAGKSGAPYRGDGIFKSTDGGLTWSQLASTSTNLPQSFDQDFDYVWRVVVDPTNTVQDEVYAATYGGIYRSVDGGSSWTFVLGDPSTRSDYTDVIVSPTGVVYASLNSRGAQNGIYRSTDGVSWTRVDPLTGDFGRIVLALAPTDENILYALVADLNETANGNDYHGFFRYNYLSGDGSGAGGTWVDRSANIQALPDQSGPGSWMFQGYGGYCQTVCVNPANPNIVYIGGVHLVRSTDGFATSANTTWMGGWTYDNHHADLHWMFFEPGSSTRAITGSDGGVHRTSNANAGTVVWDSWNNGYNTSQFYTVAIDVNDPNNDIVIGGMQDNGTWWTNTTDGSVPWIEQLGGDGSFCSIADASGPVGTYYFSVQNGVIYRFEVDVLGNWLNWTRVDPEGSTGSLFINPFITDPNATQRLYVATADGVWRNSNAEAIPLWSNDPATLNWSQLTDVPAGVAIGALAVTRDGTDTLFYGAADGHVYKVENAGTAPALASPVNLTSGKGLPSGYVSSIAIHPTDSSMILVAYSNYNIVNLWLTEDGGATWTDVEGNLTGTDSPSARSVAIMPINGTDELLLAATSTGLYSVVYRSGVSPVWEREAPSILGTAVVDMLATRPEDGLVVAGSHGRGVYSLNVPEGVDAPVEPLAAFLAQPSPNPFNPSTTVAFRLERAGHARITVHDVAGRLVRTLADGWVETGPRTVEWNGVDDSGRRVASGTYVVSLESAGQTQNRKMTLVK